MTSAGYGVVYLSPIDWAFRKQDHQFTALELTRRGRPVLFVENTGARFPSLRDAGRVATRLRNATRSAGPGAHAAPEGITVVSPLVIPGGERALERSVNRALLRRQIAPGLAALGHRSIVLWVGLPTWLAIDAVDIIKPDLLVYYCGDAFRDVPGVRSGLQRSESQLIKRADLVFANSRALVDYCRAEGAADPIFIPITLDLSVSDPYRDGSAPVPEELEHVRGRVIGYMGGLNHKLDIGLLDAVVDAFPNDTVVVLGSVEDPAYRPRSKSVLILGERPYEDIGPYLARFDVGLIPYVVNAFTRSVYPGKLIEYLAHGRPVVSTPLPEVLPYASVARIESTPAEFIKAVAEELAKPNTADARAERLRAVEPNRYQNVVTRMIDAVDERMARMA